MVLGRRTGLLVGHEEWAETILVLLDALRGSQHLFLNVNDDMSCIAYDCPVLAIITRLILV